MTLRARLLDALALATLAAAWFALWCALPGDAQASTATPADQPSWVPLAFIFGLLGICAAWAAIERIASSDDEQLADEDRAERDLERRARDAEGGL
jgi:hypothetical protein